MLVRGRHDHDSPRHVTLIVKYILLIIDTEVTVGITKKSPHGETIFESLNEPVVGEVEGGGSTEVVAVHHVENEEKQWTPRGSRGGISCVTCARANHGACVQ